MPSTSDMRHALAFGQRSQDLADAIWIDAVAPQKADQFHAAPVLQSPARFEEQAHLVGNGNAGTVHAGTIEHQDDLAVHLTHTGGPLRALCSMCKPGARGPVHQVSNHRVWLGLGHSAVRQSWPQLAVATDFS